MERLLNFLPYQNHFIEAVRQLFVRGIKLLINDDLFIRQNKIKIIDPFLLDYYNLNLFDYALILLEIS
jgi:hypothetical protein